MLGTLSLALWLIGFYLVLKYRVHIHVNIANAPIQKAHARCKLGTASNNPRGAPSSKTKHGTESGSGRIVAMDEHARAVSEIASALANLGCSKDKARQIASRVCSQPGSFDDLLRAAIREAA